MTDSINDIQEQLKCTYYLIHEAIYFKTIDFDTLISALDGLPLIERTRCLTEVSAGYNALMYAGRYRPECVPLLLKSISTLEDKDQNAIFTQRNKAGENTLILALRYQQTCVSSLLDSIKQRPLEIQATIFKQATKSGWNALLTAAKYSQSHIYDLLDIVSTFNKDDKAIILKQDFNALYEQENDYTDYEYVRIFENALGTAARHCPNAVIKFLEIINTLGAADIEIIANQSYYDLDNAFEIILSEQPHMIADWIKTVVRLDNIGLIGYGCDGYPSLALIQKIGECDVVPLLPLISRLRITEQKDFFAGETPYAFYLKNRDVLTAYAKENTAQNAFAHAETKYWLKRLHQKTENLACRAKVSKDKSIIDASEVALELYKTLEECYNLYASPESQSTPSTPKKLYPDIEKEMARLSENKTTLDIFKQTWHEAIDKARPVLEKHRGYKEVFFNLSASAVLPFIWINNKAHGRQFTFFPSAPKTDSMDIIDHTLEAVSHFDPPSC